MDRRWFPAVRCQRDDARGEWPCRELLAGPPAPPPEGGTASLVPQRDARLRRIAPSLVLVNFDMPYVVSGVSEQHYYGTGVVVDAERGYVVVDRNTIPEAMGDVRITFGGTLEIPARVAFVHPLHNLALVAYDPALIGDTPVEPVRLNSTVPDPGDELWVIGLRGGEKLVSQPTTFSSLEPVGYPLSRTMRFRESNLETLALVNPPRDIDGVVTNRKGEVVSLWSSFAWQGNGQLRQENRGMPAEYVAELLDLVRSGRALHSLEVEWAQMPLAAARRLGLPAAWAERIAGQDPERRQILSVTRTVAGSPAAGAAAAGRSAADHRWCAGDTLSRSRATHAKAGGRAGGAPQQRSAQSRSGHGSRSMAPAYVARCSGPAHCCRRRTGTWRHNAASNRPACMFPTLPLVRRLRATACLPDGASRR